MIIHLDPNLPPRVLTENLCGHDCSIPTWSLTLTLKRGPNPNHAMSVSYSLAPLWITDAGSYRLEIYLLPKQQHDRMFSE